MGGKSNLGGIERRTVVRAGAWSVPVVAVAVAAPAHACSPENSLQVLTFTATYRHYNTSTTAEPMTIDVTSTLKNNGSKPTASFSRTLTIPANLFDSVATSPSPGYLTTPAPTVDGSYATGWTITYQRTAPLPAGDTDSFSVTLTVGSTTVNPYRGWQGPAFPMGYAASGGVTCNAPSGTFEVPATAVTTLTISSWKAVRFDTALFVGTDSATSTTVGGPATSSVTNSGRKAVGPITLEVTVPRNSSGRFQSVTNPLPADVATGWAFTGRTDNLDSWTFRFTTTPATLYWAPTQQTPVFRARIGLTGNSGTNPATSITAVAKATGASDSTPPASDPA